MKSVRRLLCLAAFAVLPDLPAQQPESTTKPEIVQDAQAKPTPPPAAPMKPADVEKAKVHVLAAMEVKIGGGGSESVLIELYPNDAPNTVKNFINNVNKGFYKGLAFHRAIKDYLVQVGDPKSKDQTTRDQWGLTQEYTIPGEPKLPHLVGSVAMARRNAKVNPKLESDGTQFYIAVGNLSALNGSYTVFGQVIEGMDVVKRMSEITSDSNDCPLARIEIKKMVISEHKGPVVTIVKVGKKKRQTKPDSLKSPLERFLERIW
jgi:cyclophilin family peptidyl-prolyl cis-trans isomerase